MPGAATAPITEKDNWHIGEDFTFDFQIDNGVIGTSPPDIGSWSDVRWYVRERPDDDDLVLELTFGTDISFQTPDIFRVAVKAAMTALWTPGTYWHTLSRLDAGAIHDLSEGPATILRSARR